MSSVTSLERNELATFRQPRVVRASRMGLAMACPASLDTDGIYVDGASDEALVGTAIHVCLAGGVMGRLVDPVEAAIAYGVDVEECTRLYWMGMALWRKLQAHYPDPQTEVAMAAGNLTGHADVLSIVGTEARVLDWKTGYADTDHREQLRAYGWLALADRPECETAYVATVYVRTGQIEAERFTREQLDSWYVRAEDRLTQRDRFSPGAHCRFCPRRLTCPAARAMLQLAAATLMDAERGSFDLPDSVVNFGEWIGDLYFARKQINAICDQAHELVKAIVADNGGRLDVGGGYELTLERQAHRKIRYADGAPIIEDAIGSDALAECLTVSKGKVESAVKANALPRRKGKDLLELFERLEEAGAIETEYVERLETRRIMKEISE